MRVLRTPDDRFADLDGYACSPHYLDVDDATGSGESLRMHYVDEGPTDGQVVLMLHGEPTWSYLYRKMIPILASAGLRAIAPDLVGFGRSDKPADRADYTYARHVAWMAALIAGLDLRGVTLVGQDWGGLIGLRLVAEHPERFARVVAANTFLPTGETPANEAFVAWRDYSQNVRHFDAGRIVSRTCLTDLEPEVVAAYDAPFPDESFKEGARQFPVLVPTSPDNPAASANRSAWEVLSKWDKPFLTAFSDSDPITRGGDRAFRSRIPGASSQPHTTIAAASHFLQEDKGEELAKVVVDFVSG